MAPAPGRNYPLLIKHLKVLHPSSRALSTSSKRLWVDPLKTMVDNLQSSVSLLKTVTFYDPIS